ncbi:MAG: hypothetical protein M3Q78_09915, partial [Acidobacteriota bacterium]|nr:hypothetical protein [Acidobacteriota bacterium]
MCLTVKDTPFNKISTFCGTVIAYRLQQEGKRLTNLPNLANISKPMEKNIMKKQLLKFFALALFMTGLTATI